MLPVGQDRGAVAITSQEAARLGQIGQSRPGFCTFGHQSVRLAQYAGLVSLGERVLEILPKVDDQEGTVEIGRGIFLRLLHLSGNVKLFSSSQVGHDLRRQSLLEVFISAYFDELYTLVRTGLLKRYQTEEADLPLIRGRLLIGRQAAAHAMRVDRLACRFDELTADNVWNRSLKAALYATKPWISSIDLRRQWLGLAAVMDDVSLQRLTPADLEALDFDRQAVRYKAAIQWATWIVRLLSPNLRFGKNEAPGLVFDMNRLFESAVAVVLQQNAAARSDMRVSPQDTGRYVATVAGTSGIPAFGLRPDIVVRESGEVVAVADTKWARVGVTSSGYLEPDSAHVYQMQAYASVYPCEQFTLIYPWHSGLKRFKPTVFHLPPNGTRRPILSITCVDVGSDRLNSVSGSAETSIDRLLGAARSPA